MKRATIERKFRPPERMIYKPFFILFNYTYIYIYIYQLDVLYINIYFFKLYSSTLKFSFFKISFFCTNTDYISQARFKIIKNIIQNNSVSRFIYNLKLTFLLLFFAE
jgi:hypothetical protein